MFGFAAKQRYLPPYCENPLAQLPWARLGVADSKPIFVFDEATEVAFWGAVEPFWLTVHFTLAKTGLRVGEAVHLLVEDIDWDSRWLLVRNKPGLGWRVKTGLERRVPLLTELAVVLRRLVGGRTSGPVFLRQCFVRGRRPLLTGTLGELEDALRRRSEEAGSSQSGAERARQARQVWRDAGALKSDDLRRSFARAMRRTGRPEATCPKSWRHTFATLLQDANIDPLVRQLALGHRPGPGAGLGMTAVYTHTRPETLRAQIEAALRRWPDSLRVACVQAGGVQS